VPGFPTVVERDGTALFDQLQGREHAYDASTYHGVSGSGHGAPVQLIVMSVDRPERPLEYCIHRV
jgi:hypothetical protein